MAICLVHGEEKVKSRCKKCRAEYMRLYHRRRFDTEDGYRERVRKAWKDWATQHPQQLNEHKRRYALKKYGLTSEGYERLLIQQGGKCAICGSTPKRLDVDHDHETGVVRGLLCRKCNLGLGLVSKPDLLRRAITYLENSLFAEL